MRLADALPEIIREATGKASALSRKSPLGGGCISRTSLVELEDGRSFFLKSNSQSPAGFFECEAEGLRELQRAGALRVPEVVSVGSGTDGLPGFILLEFIPTGRPAAGFFESFGRALARLHLEARGSRFGFGHDNYLGSTPQPNPWTSDWVEFFRRHRLGHQLDLACRTGLSDARMNQLGERLLDRLGDWLGQPEQPPGLLHGDLWGGNYLCDGSGAPVLIDPAAYYGHGEAELAMSRLFGGFDAKFYHAYEEVRPSAPGAAERLEIYQLYHLLNHLNLFGRSYLSGCMRILERFGA